MALDPINTGTAPNDGSGDKLRAAFGKVNENDQYLEGKATTAQQTAESAGTAAQQAQEAADEAGLAAEQANTDLAAHKTSGDHDDRYLKLDQVVTAPAAGKTPKAGEAGTFAPEWIEGLVNRLKYLESVAENVDWTSIAPLWANGRDGFLWDVQDLSSLFADMNGQSPAVFGGPVGVVLDMKAPGARGPELSPDANPPLATTDGWVTTAGADVALVNGAVVATLTTSSGGGQTYKEIPGMVAGKWYEYVAKINAPQGLRVQAWSGVDMAYKSYPPGTTEVRLLCFATGTALRPRLYIGQSSSPDINSTLTILSQSLREIPGHHLYQPVSTARSTLKIYATDVGANQTPDYATWTYQSGWNWNGATLEKTETEAGAATYFSVPLKPLTYYRFTTQVAALGGVGGGVRPFISGTPGAGQLNGEAFAEVGTNVQYLATRESDSRAGLTSGGGNTATITDFQVQEVFTWRYWLKPDGVDDFYNISGGAIDLTQGAAGFAAAIDVAVPSGFYTTLSNATGTRALNFRRGNSNGWRQSNVSVEQALPPKPRQSVLYSTMASGYAQAEDSTGAVSALDNGGTPQGVGIHDLFLVSNAGQYPWRFPIYGAIGRAGAATEFERKQMLRWLDSCLVEVSE